ncbi:MAG TPA: hypothetical protein VNW25_01210 [Candidatus Sulfotelmatobacter sp.]|nr:hypothetical protein [Candidatus Sulfotelmatobacter sp.]
MLEYLRQHWHSSLATLNFLATKYSPLILGGLIALTTFQKLTLILHTDGGGDLLGADIPKSMMLIAGQNPYTSNPWASPYPPFLLAVVGAIIRLTSTNTILAPDTISLISRNVRMTGLVADATVALLVFATLRARRVSGLSALIPAALFLALPSISLSPYYWFNSDVLGYPILAASVLALVVRRYFLGSVLLATATIFKIHPILAVPLVLVWLAKRRGIAKSISTIITTVSVLSLGLALPAILPGYLESVLGFNLSSGFGGGTSSFTMMNLLYAVFPSVLHLSLPTTLENQVWLASTAALFAVALGIVWSRARELSPVDIVSIGLLVWLIPLRQIYTHYLVWAIVPVLMRGRLRQTLMVGSLLEIANTMSSWSWNLPPDPFPVLATPYGFFATSLVYLSVSLTALVFILREIGARPQLDIQDAKSSVVLERYPIPVIRST